MTETNGNTPLLSKKERDHHVHTAAFHLFNALEGKNWAHPRMDLLAQRAFQFHILILWLIEYLVVGLVVLTFFEKPLWSIQEAINTPTSIWIDTTNSSAGGAFPGNMSRYPSWPVPFLEYFFALHLEVAIFAVLVADTALIRFAQGAGFFTDIRMKRRSFYLALYGLDLIVAICTPPEALRLAPYLRVLLYTNFAPAIRDVIILAVSTFTNTLQLLLLLFWEVFFFAWLALILFPPSSPEGQQQMTDMGSNMWNLYILLTTANFPDVMMPAYDNNRVSCLFFIAFLLIGFLLLTSMILGEIFSTYTAAKEENAKELKTNRDWQVREAYRILDAVIGEDDNSVSNEDLLDMLSHLKQYKSVNHALDDGEIIRNLDVDGSNEVDSEEFLAFGKVLQKKIATARKPPYLDSLLGGSSAWARLKRMVQHGLFEHFITVMLLVAAGLTAHRTWHRLSRFAESQEALSRTEERVLLVSHVTFDVPFCAVFVLEAGIKIITHGWDTYRRSLKNSYDFGTTMLAAAGTLYALVDPDAPLTIVRTAVGFQVLRVTRLGFRSAQYQMLAVAIARILPQAFLLSKVLFVVMYVFSCFGVQCFGGLISIDADGDLTNEAVAAAWSGGAGYFANNFNDMFSAMNTLFEFLIVNNWFELTDGFVAATGSYWPRAFFVTWLVFGVNICLNIVMSIVIDVMSSEKARSEELVQGRHGVNLSGEKHHLRSLTTRDLTALLYDDGATA